MKVYLLHLNWTYNEYDDNEHWVGLRICNNCYDKERKLLGIIFRTEQEAKDYLPTWQKRLEGERL